jgi:hypothetical protein
MIFSMGFMVDPTEREEQQQGPSNMPNSNSNHDSINGLDWRINVLFLTIWNGLSDHGADDAVFRITCVEFHDSFIHACRYYTADLRSKCRILS